MPATWVVLADSARARILARVSVHELHEVEALAHPESRLHQGDLRTGGEGSVTDRMGQGQRQTGARVDTGEKHTEAFAREIADYLSKARSGGRFQHLIVAAEPALLGALRKHLDSPTASTIERTVDKNWLTRTPDELIGLLDQST